MIIRFGCGFNIIVGGAVAIVTDYEDASLQPNAHGGTLHVLQVVFDSNTIIAVESSMQTIGGALAVMVDGARGSPQLYHRGAFTDVIMEDTVMINNLVIGSGRAHGIFLLCPRMHRRYI